MIFGFGKKPKKSRFDLDTVLDRVADALSLDRDSMVTEPITTGKFNESYSVTVGDDAYFLRIAPADDTGFLFYEKQMMQQEPAIAKRILSETDVPVAEVVFHDFSHDVCDRDFMVMKKLPGMALSEAGSQLSEKDSDSLMKSVGANLRRIHSLEGSAFGYVGQHSPMAPQDSWADAFDVMWSSMIDDIAGCKVYPKQLIDPLRGFAGRSARLFGYKGPPMLLHMDIWAQNIMCDTNGNLTGLIDWDRALYGDPEIEYSVLSYCGISRDPFWQGYGKYPESTTESQLRQAFYFLYEHQKYIVICNGRRNDPVRAQSYASDCLASISTLARTIGDRELMKVI